MDARVQRDDGSNTDMADVRQRITGWLLLAAVIVVVVLIWLNWSAYRDAEKTQLYYHSILRSDIPFVVVHDSKIVSWSDGMTRLSGFDRADVIGESIEVLIPARMRQKHREGMRKVEAGTPLDWRLYQVDCPLVCADGVELPVRIAVRPDIADGKKLFIVSFTARNNIREQDDMIEDEDTLN